MNKTDVIKKVSEMSEVDFSDCEKVIKALEEVLEDEFKSSEGLCYAFGKICRLMEIFKIKKI